MEIEAGGAYETLQWVRNGNPVGTRDFRPSATAFSHFSEVYATAPTTHADYGLYTINLLARGGILASVSLSVLGFSML